MLPGQLSTNTIFITPISAVLTAFAVAVSFVSAMLAYAAVAGRSAHILARTDSQRILLVVIVNSTIVALLLSRCCILGTSRDAGCVCLHAVSVPARPPPDGAGHRESYELAPQNVHLYPISLNARIPYYYLPPIFAPAPMWRGALTADDVTRSPRTTIVPMRSRTALRW